MDGLGYEKSIAALACWREMRGDLYNGMIAVAAVLRNRAKAGWHHSSIYENAIAQNQLSSMSIRNDPNTVLYPDAREPQFQKLLLAMEGIYDNTVADPTQGSLYYANLSQSTSGWFFENIANNPTEHPRVMQMGQTYFYR